MSRSSHQKGPYPESNEATPDNENTQEVPSVLSQETAIHEQGDTELQLYKQALRNLPDEYSELMKIPVKIMDFIHHHTYRHFENDGIS